MKQVRITDFLTDEDIASAVELYEQLKGTGRFAETLARDLIAPNIARINAAIGQENDPKFLAYAVEYVFSQVARDVPPSPTPTRLWELADDICAVCGKTIGFGVRLLHLRLCDTCRDAPKH